MWGDCFAENSLICKAGFLHTQTTFKQKSTAFVFPKYFWCTKRGAHKHLEQFSSVFYWKMQTLPKLDPVWICCLTQKNKKACVIVDIFTNLKRRIENGLLWETFWNLRKSRGKNLVSTLVELVGKKNMLPSCMLINDLTPMENSGVLHGSFRQKIQETYNISREVDWNMEDYYQIFRKNFESRKF